MSVQSTVLYRATLGTWTTAQVDDLDSVLQSLYRNIYKMMPSYPGDLLQLPTQWGGTSVQQHQEETSGLQVGSNSQE